MTYRICYIDFVNSSALYSGVNRFYIEGESGSFWNKQQRGNVSITRTINKNLIQSQLPVDTYNEGGLSVDIGMCNDTFSIDFTTHSWEEYELINDLVKVNTGLVHGTFVFGSTLDNRKFKVAVSNLTSKFASGKGDYVQINLSLVVIGSQFT